MCFALVIVDLEIISKEFLHPTNLFEAQTLCIYETTKIVMICKNMYLVLTTFKIVTLYFENFDNSLKLTIIGFLLSFYKNYFSRKGGYLILLAQIDLSDYPIGSNYKKLKHVYKVTC